ncbi:MAG: M48 family metalloprotease, partial [Candidatus Babeliales bacterium]
IVNRSIYWTAFTIAHELSHYKQWSEQNYNLAINIKKGWLPSVFSRLPVNKLPTLVTQAKYLYYKRQNEFDADLRAVKLLKNTQGAYEFCNFWFAITKGLEDREKKIPATKHWYSNLIDFCYSSYINPFFTRYPSFTTHPSFQARLNFIKKHTSDDPCYNHQDLFDANLDLEGVLTLKKTPFIYKVCIYQCKATQTKHRTRLKFFQKYASHLYHTSPASSVK